MSDKERLENIRPTGFDLDGNVLLRSEDYHWLMEQVEHRQKLLERLNKRGIEVRKLKSQLSRCREKIKKLEWNSLVLKGTADDAMRMNRSNYELANKLEEQNKRLREALEYIERIQSVDVAQQIARKALDGDDD